jgi:HEAT repeat protein
VSKGKKAAIVLLLLLAGLAVGYWILNPTEPSYQGRSASSWLHDLGTPNYLQAYAALKAMGTNAVPAIVRRLKRSASPWRIKYRELYPKFPSWLAKTLPKPKSDFNRVLGGWAFAAIGPGVKPRLVKLLKEESPSVRSAAAFGLHELRLSGADIKDAIPALIEALSDQSGDVRYSSAQTLGLIGPEAESAVPALIPLLTDSHFGPGVRVLAFEALGMIGPKAKAAMPALRNLLTTNANDLYWGEKTAVAIWRIDGDVTNTLPVLIQGLSQPDPQERGEAIDVMAEMGPQAKAAVPVLLNELSQPTVPAIIATDADSGQKITNALKQIDPEAAAKAGVK